MFAENTGFTGTPGGKRFICCLSTETNRLFDRDFSSGIGSCLDTCWSASASSRRRWGIEQALVSAREAVIARTIREIFDGDVPRAGTTWDMRWQAGIVVNGVSESLDTKWGKSSRSNRIKWCRRVLRIIPVREWLRSFRQRLCGMPDIL
jgi:hypothetical protein